MRRKNRKQLPPVAKVGSVENLSALKDELERGGLLDVESFRDFDYSPSSSIAALLARNLTVRKLALSENEAAQAAKPEDFKGSGYLQRALSESKLATSQLSSPTLSLEEMESKSPKQRIRRLDRSSKYYVAETDERNYGILKSEVGSELRKVSASLGGHLCRVRLAALMPGASIQPHRDYDPSYLVRYHVPLNTNPDSWLFVQQKTHVDQYHLEADGSIYFLNAGLIHWVKNLGTSPRIHLLIDVDGQDALRAWTTVQPSARFDSTR